MSLPSCTNEETEEELKSWHDWVGSRVSISGTKIGTLRYFGKTHFAEGLWCGVELDEPVGKNNGTVKDVRYFTCKTNFGIFAPLSKTEKLPDKSHNAAMPIFQKSKLPQSKSRLKFMPLQSEISKSFNETICLHAAKSNLPHYQSNANEPKTNIVNEMYQKHRKSEDFLEKRELNHFNNNTSPLLELGHLKIAERRTSTPVVNPFRKHSTARMTDFLNKTMTLNFNRKNSCYNQESLKCLQDNSLLDTTFDLTNTSVADKKEKTFILQNANILSTDFNKRLSDGCIDYEEDPKSSELEESLGILSPSQMKDFTLSFDNNIGTSFYISPKIKKIESCDDVTEIPEFEDNRMYQELPGGSYDTMINFDPQKPLKRNSNTNTQIFDPLIGTPKEKTDNTSAEFVAEQPNIQLIKNITPTVLNKLKDNFSFLDFHPAEDVNLNALPSATSTPTFTTLKLSKLSTVKKTRSNFISSDIDCSCIEQKNCSSTLNQTFNHSPESKSYTSKVNVISKLLNDLDQAKEISDMESNIFKLDNSECELFVAASQDISSEIKSGATGNGSVFIKNENVCCSMTMEETYNLKLEDDSENRLSETFSCSTIKVLDELESQDTSLNNERIDKYLPDDVPKSEAIVPFSDSSSFILKGNQDFKYESEPKYLEETHVLDVTMTVMKIDNLNVTVNIDENKINGESQQISNTICDESDSAQSKQSPILQNVLSSAGNQFSNGIKKYNDTKSVPSKKPQKNVISKIKLMLESDKNSYTANQENKKLKHNITNPKKMGKWDSVTSKIAAGLTNSKKNIKKEVTSRVNTNLNASRQTMSNINEPQSRTKYPSKVIISRKSEVGNKVITSNNQRNSLNNQTVCEESKSVCSTNKVNGEKDLRILAQLQNVDCDNKQPKDSKANQKNKRMGLLSKATDVLSRSNSLSSSSSRTSFAAPKIQLQPKTSTPVQTKRINENRSDSVTPNEKPVPGKNNKASHVNGCSQTTRPKFISKVFLVKQVRTLVNLCETRKQEIKRLEAKIRHACLGFDALAICYKHISEQYDPFSQRLLSSAYKKSKADLQKATEELLSCEEHLENLKTIHSQEVRELTKKLGNIHSGEIKELKLKHSAELENSDTQHKKEISILKKTFQLQAEDYKRNQDEIFETLEKNHKNERLELQQSYKAQLGVMETKHNKVKNELEKQLTVCTNEYVSLQKQLQIMEEKFMEDKNSIVQHASAKKILLQKEISSLNAVVEIRNGQLREISNENIKWKEKVEELHIIKGQINLYKAKEEEYKALLEEKAQLERMQFLKNEEWHQKFIALSRINNELQMKNEELQYKLQLYIEQIYILSDTTENQRIRVSMNRSNSLSSLPSLTSEKFCTSANTTAKSGINSKGSMSFSCDPYQPTHKKESLPKSHVKCSFGSSSYSQVALNYSMSMSWGGENVVDYYESLDNKNFDISSKNWEERPVNYQLTKPIFVVPKETEVKRNDGNCLSLNKSMDMDKSLSGVISLQSSYNSDSSNSCFATRPESEESSSSCSQKSKDSDLKDTCDHVVYDDVDPLGMKHPRNLAGEAMVQDINSMLLISKKIKLVNKDEFSQTEENFSSPEENKDKLINNQLSMATPSIDTLSSQGMADSTNLDVSWGDEEILSENDA